MVNFIEKIHEKVDVAYCYRLGMTLVTRNKKILMIQEQVKYLNAKKLNIKS